MIQVSPSLTVVDLTTRGLSPGTYWATIRETGNTSSGAASTGGIWGAPESVSGQRSPPTDARGLLGTITVGRNGVGSVFLDRPVQIWEVIGRGMVVSRHADGKLYSDDDNVLVGVIARSAGVWENDKTVCSCSGKTLWQERKEVSDRGLP